MTVKKTAISIHRYTGLSTDTKPTGVPEGSTFLATNTNSLYITPDGGATWVLKDATGEVQASPTSNTLLDRLKALLTGIVLAAGSAIIGKVRLVTALGDEITDDTADAIKAKLSANSGVDIGDVDVLSIAVGSNIIGKVGHDKTGIGHGVKTVTTAGTDVALVASSTPAKVAIIQAQTDNTGVIAVGATGVDATIATGTGVVLYAGDSITLEVDDLVDIFIDSTVSGDGVRYTYLT